MRGTVAGSGSATATLAGATLSISGTFEGLKSPATAATLHSGVARGVRGVSVGGAGRVESGSRHGDRFGDADAGPGERPSRRPPVSRSREREGARRESVGMDSEVGQASAESRRRTLKAGRKEAKTMRGLRIPTRAGRHGPRDGRARDALRAAGARRSASPRRRRPRDARPTRPTARAATSPDLKGSGDAAQLAGSEFMDAWGRRTTRELLSFMQLTMPPTRPGALSQEEYLNIAAFILQSNGALAGNSALTPQRRRRDQLGARGARPRRSAAARRRRDAARLRRPRRRRAGAGGPPGRRRASRSPAK